MSEFTRRHPEQVRKLALIDPAGIGTSLPLAARVGVAPGVGEYIMRVAGTRQLLPSRRMLLHPDRYPAFDSTYLPWSCGACNAGIPQLRATKQSFDSDDFAIVGVTDYRGRYAHEKNLSKTREYELMRDHCRTQRKVDWPISMTETGMINYRIDRTPTYLLIGRNGLVREWDANISYSYLTERIKTLVEGTN